ncbi:spermidine synthase, partial [Aminicella lysinilytica]|uniref:spermidine synthase n=1 Tax=Aminicella lysinilytica TaxID=433323 RepID=UPI0026EB7E24
AYLQTVDTKYDVIMVDASQDITIPFQMSSVEFFRLVQEHLNDSGVMVVNMNMRSGSDGINQYLADTISNVFPYVYTADVEGSTNRELFASAADFDKEAFEKVASEHDEADFRNLMAKVGESLVKYSKGEYLLTDDKAPVELLSMQAIDDIIGNEIGVYKKVFEEKGLEGLLDSM